MPPPKSKQTQEEEEEDPDAKPKVQTTTVARQLPDVDIFEMPNFGDEKVDKDILELQTNLREKLKKKDLQEKYIAYNDLGKYLDLPSYQNQKNVSVQYFQLFTQDYNINEIGFHSIRHRRFEKIRSMTQ